MRNTNQNCPKCNRNISPDADECPGCGLGLKLMEKKPSASERLFENW